MFHIFANQNCDVIRVKSFLKCGRDPLHASGKGHGEVRL